jgi:hypothetical protein
MHIESWIKTVCVASLGLLAPAMVLAAAPKSADEPVAMITDLKGAVSVHSALGDQGADLLMSLQPGAELRIPAAGSVTLVYYASARRYTYAGADTVSVGAQSPSAGSGAPGSSRVLAPAGDTGLDARQVQELVQGGMQMRNFDPRKRIRLKSPVRTALLERGPVFVWEPLESGTQYRFTLRDDAGLVLLETLMDSTRLRLPQEIRLHEGVNYTWQVDARAVGGNAYSASTEFSLLPAAQRALIEGRRPSADAEVSDVLVYALLLQENNLRDEAGKIWSVLAGEHPESGSLQRLAADAPGSARAP